MKISLVQMNIVWENSLINMKKCESFIKDAHDKESNLILFPEMTLTGFTMNISSLNLKEEFILDWIKGQAIKYDINIGLGFGIKNGDKAKNKYVIISRFGVLLSSYTKIHPFTYGKEDLFYSKGKEVVVCTIDNINISTFICYDLRFPELFQVASKKSHLITVGASWPEERLDHWYTLLKARAIENQCFVAGINRCGEGGNLYYKGSCVIVSPSGEFLNKIINDESLVTVEVDFNLINKVKSTFDIKKDRRDKLYLELLK